jgi:hypothetical protein
VQHKNGECLAEGATPCICCVWYQERERGRSLVLELQDDYDAALTAMLVWLDRPAVWRGSITAVQLKQHLRGLRFNRLLVGEVGQLNGVDYSWAKLEHEGAGVFEGIGGSYIDAVADAVTSYITRIVNKPKEQLIHEHQVQR